MKKKPSCMPELITMRFIENCRTGSFRGIRHYEMTLNSTQLEHPNSDVVLLTDYEYNKRIRIWVPGFAHHGDTTYKVTAVVRAYSRREKRGDPACLISYKRRMEEMSRSHGDHTTHRDMTLHIEDYKQK